MRADIAEAVSVWQRAGYNVRLRLVHVDGRPFYACYIWPASYGDTPPHSWEGGRVVMDGCLSEDGAVLSALRAAAAKWEGVV